MSVNNMTLEQGAAFLGAVVSQMQGGALATVNSGNFTSVAQNALLQGYDPLNTAISQVLARTIYSIRPYNGKLKGLLKDPQRFGNMTRKVNYIDGVLEDDQHLYYTGTTPYVNGNVPTPDQYAIRKPLTWQSNWYGSELVQRTTTIFRNQLDTAMSSQDEFSRFIAGQIQNIYDQFEQVHDARARQALINFIGGKIRLDTTDSGRTHVVHLFTEYANDSGVSLTPSTYMAPANYKPFVEWLYARIATLADLMSERGHNFNYSPTLGGSKAFIERHTPKDRLKAYFIASEFNRIQSMAISEVFNKSELRMIDFEPINYWQSSADPMNIDAKVTVNDATVNITGPSVNDLEDYTCTTTAPVLGVLFDDDAIGISIKFDGVFTSPLHITGLYYNQSWHENVSVINDFCESGCVLMLD